MEKDAKKQKNEELDVTHSDLASSEGVQCFEDALIHVAAMKDAAMLHAHEKLELLTSDELEEPAGHELDELNDEDAAPHKAPHSESDAHTHKVDHLRDRNKRRQSTSE